MVFYILKCFYAACDFAELPYTLLPEEFFVYFLSWVLHSQNVDRINNEDGGQYCKAHMFFLVSINFTL